jgi:oligosaccharide reducing-end xylanase
MGSFDNKTYRNVFKEIGKTQEEIDAKIKEAVDTFFYDDVERIYHPAGDDMGYLVDTGNNDARTEGMSYGMMMCVQLDMKEEFDRIWKWAKTFMYMEEGDNEGYFAWSCQLDGTKNAYGPAPDGEEFFAMALFFASHRWGDGEGIYNYSKQAKEILRACLHKGENGRVGDPMWNRDNGQILFEVSGDAGVTRCTEPAIGAEYKEGQTFCYIQTQWGQLLPVPAALGGKLVDITAKQGQKVLKGQPIIWLEREA